MTIDEHELNKKIRRTHRAYGKLKQQLKKRIARDIKRGEETDLLWLCERAGLSPKDGASLYQLLYDQIPDAPKGETTLSTTTLDDLVLQRDEVEPWQGKFRLRIDPKYRFRILMVSDTHLGSGCDNLEGLEAMYDHAVDIGAKAVFHSGDLTDGLKKHADMYIHLRGDAQLFDQQYDRVVECYPRREGVMTYFIAGNHDHFARDKVGVDICRYIDIARDDMVYLKSQGIREAGELPEDIFDEVMQERKYGSGRIGAVRIGPYHLAPQKRHTILMMMHPGDGSAKTMSYKPQNIISRLDTMLHSFDNMQNPSGKRIKPHLLQIGHYHNLDVTRLRNVYVFQAGTMKLADEFHDVRALRNMMGYWVVDLTTDKRGDITRIGYEAVPAYVPKRRAIRTVAKMAA